MSLAVIKTNRNVVQQLQNAISDNRISHAYLFTGPDEIRKRIGFEFAKALLCEESKDDACDVCISCRKMMHGNHEDFFTTQKSGASIRKDEVLGIIERLSYKPFGKRNIAIIDDADAMTVEAQNKLLKTLEEPPGRSVILLLAERKQALLPTVLSRCVQFMLSEDITISAEAMETGSLLINQCMNKQPFYKRLETVAPYLADRACSLELLDAVSDQLREDLIAAVEGKQYARIESIRVAVKQVEQAKLSLRSGHNISYAMKRLCLLFDRDITEETV